ncbi:hypothetical protein ACTXT7_005320 [Hymenolepis weldensis]
MDFTSAAGKLSAAHRQFYTLPKLPDLSDVDSTIYHLKSSARSSTTESQKDTNIHGFDKSEDFFDYINKSVIGYNKVFTSVFGDRRVVYCDYIASGRSLSFIEDFIYNEVLPNYGNTHTLTSVTSIQTTMYRHEAKDIVRNAVRASDYDALFFVGSGCTGAVHKLIHNLHLENPPIVITGPFEHHSNMLPWRHLAAKIVRLKTDKSGNVSYKHLGEVLGEEEKNAKNLGCHVIVCLAAASNVTGILVDVDKFSALVHRHGGLVFWDYATAAPYVRIDMNPVVVGPECNLVYKDAVYFSMHKFVGGVQTPGVLIAKRVLFKAGEKYPDGCGGGSDVEEREEGGTPAIIESIRAGLAMQLKEAITPEVIMAREEVLVKRAWKYFKKCPNLLVLGGDEAPRLPIFSVVIRHVFPDITATEGQNGEQQPCNRPMYLHHTFVAALLNDLFGIQCRSGCVCAGPYAMDLLGIDESLAKLYEDALVISGTSACHMAKPYESVSREVLRPGFTRFSIPYFMSDEEANFVLEAVCFIAEYGWAFLPLYTHDTMTGEWKHRKQDQLEGRQWLGHIKYAKEGMVWRRAKPKARGALPKTLQDCLLAAKVELKRAVDFVKNSNVSPVPDVTASFDQISQKLRWFVLPCEAAAQIRGEIGQLAISTGPSSPWIPGTMDPCTSTLFSATSSKSVKSEDTLCPCSQNENTQSPARSLSPNQSNELSIDTALLCIVHFFSPNPHSNSGGHLPPEEHSLHDFQQRNNNYVVDNSNPPIICRGSPQLSSVAVNEDVLVGSDEEIDIEELDVIKGLYVSALSTKRPNGPSLRMNKKDEMSLWRRPIKQLYKPFLQAIIDFKMIQPGDKILVCLSGGKDSLSLLHCMHAYQETCRRRADYPSFEIGAVTVDPGSSAFDPRPLIPYLAELGVEYLYEEQKIMDKATELGDQCSSICSFCSRMKRGRIYAAALKHGYNVIALGQHLDDLAESVRTCFLRSKNLRVIRPLVHVREKMTRAFAEMAGLPVIPENCPACFQMPKERMRVKRILGEYESVFPNLYSSLQSAMMPLISRGAALGLSGYEDAKNALSGNPQVHSDPDDNLESLPFSCPRPKTK